MAQFEHNSEKFGYIDLEAMDGVQTALQLLGLEPGAADGRDGPKTQNAVRQFQARSTIKIDGIVGDETRGALVTALSQAEASQGSQS